MLSAFDNRRLIFVTGKGGVGKSTCTAALAVALAEAGRRVLVAETDPYSAMDEFLGLDEPSGTPREARENLWIANLRAEECLVSTLTRFLPSERIVRALTQNRVTESFFKSAPSVSEFVLLDHIQLFAERGDWDHVIVDLPASGHAVTFLSVPKTLNGMMRGLGPIAKRAEAITQQITHPSRSAIVAVCLPEEMPVNETIELSGQLDDVLGRSLDLVMVNTVHRAPIDGAYRAAFLALSDRVRSGRAPAEILADVDADSLVRLVAGNAVALEWYERDIHYLGVLRGALDVPLLEIPMMYEIDDAALVARVAAHLLDPHDPSDADVLAS